MVDLSFLGDVGRDLQAAVDEGRRHQATAERTLALVAWGEDPAGVVRAGVNAQGGFVAVTLAPRWRSFVDEEELGGAVVAAVRAAEAARAAGELQPAPDELASPPESPPSTPQSTPPALPRSPDEAMRWVAELIEEVESSLADVREVATRAASADVVGHSACGRVTATARAGVLTSVESDPSWLREGAREAVQAALTQALGEALPGTMPRVTAAVRGTGRVGELLDLAADPVGLLASLGLGRADTGARHGA